MIRAASKNHDGVAVIVDPADYGPVLAALKETGNGILFIDYLSRLKRDRVIKKFTKQARQAERKSSDRGAA